MKAVSIILIFNLLLLGCSGLNESTNSNIHFGKNLNGYKYGDIYFSGQPSNDDFNELKEQGFSTVINLREKSEYNEKSERDIVKSTRMKYVNIPFPKEMNLTNKMISRVTSAVMESRGEGKVLVHCSSGNRVGLWLGGHFYKDHGFSKQRSLSTAKKLGLSKKEAIDKLSIFLNNN